jgi:hypothetical protein
MKVRKVIDKTLSQEHVAAGLHAVIAANVNEGSSKTSVSNRHRIVQRSSKSKDNSEDRVSDDSSERRDR